MRSAVRKIQSSIPLKDVWALRLQVPPCPLQPCKPGFQSHTLPGSGKNLGGRDGPWWLKFKKYAPGILEVEGGRVNGEAG